METGSGWFLSGAARAKLALNMTTATCVEVSVLNLHKPRFFWVTCKTFFLNSLLDSGTFKVMDGAWCTKSHQGGWLTWNSVFSSRISALVPWDSRVDCVSCFLPSTDCRTSSLITSTCCHSNRLALILNLSLTPAFCTASFIVKKRFDFYEIWCRATSEEQRKSTNMKSEAKLKFSS